MLMKELKEKKLISSRLYNRLFFVFKNEPNNIEEYYKILVGYIWNCTYIGDVNYDYISKEYLEHCYETFPIGKKNEICKKYFDRIYQKFTNSSLEKVLKKLNIQEPEDIMQFRGLGKKSVSELRALISMKGE